VIAAFERLSATETDGHTNNWLTDDTTAVSDTATAGKPSARSLGDVSVTASETAPAPQN
jgi:hypothetical protein